MLLQSGFRVLALLVAPAVFTITVDHDLTERPRIIHVDPQMAAPGDIVTASGANLDRSHVSELILADSDRTIITHIVEQTPSLLRFRVPRMLEPGEYRIVLVADRRWGTEMIEQEVMLRVIQVD